MPGDRPDLDKFIDVRKYTAVRSINLDDVLDAPALDAEALHSLWRSVVDRPYVPDPPPVLTRRSAQLYREFVEQGLPQHLQVEQPGEG